MLLSMKIHQTRNRRCKGSGAGAGLVYSQNIKDADEPGEMSRGKTTKRYSQTNIGWEWVWYRLYRPCSHGHSLTFTLRWRTVGGFGTEE